MTDHQRGSAKPYKAWQHWLLTVLSESAALTRGTREGILYAFDEKIIIDVANTNRDLLRDGGRDPEK